MANPKVFLSHSSKSAYALRVLDRLAQALRAKGFDILLDKERLCPGQEWRAKLHDWLATCHGAVILFSREAIGGTRGPGSDWVLKEATILTWRRALNPRLLVVPALLGDVGREETKKAGFGPLQLDELQFASAPTADETDANADAVTQAIVAQFDGFTPGETDPLLSKWRRRVRACLRKVDGDDLAAAADAVGIPQTDRGMSGDELCDTLAHHFLCSDLKAVLPALRELRNSLPADQVPTFADLVLPIWVPQEAARGILPITRRPEAQRLLSINTDYAALAEHFLKRATCCQPEVAVVKTTGVAGEAVDEEILAAYRRAFERELGVEPGRPPKVVLEACRQHSEPFFALVSQAALVPGVLRALRDYPKVTLVLMPGLSGVDAATVGVPALEAIRPQLDEASQLEAEVTVSQAREALRIST
jgi:hypothetical protein